MGKRRLQPRRKGATEGRVPGSQTRRTQRKKPVKPRQFQTKCRLRANAARAGGNGHGAPRQTTRETSKKFPKIGR